MTKNSDRGMPVMGIKCVFSFPCFELFTAVHHFLLVVNIVMNGVCYSK